MCLYVIEWIFILRTQLTLLGPTSLNSKQHDLNRVFALQQEGNLKRYPTPYPDELKNMVKTAQSVAHRLKEDESGDESGKDAKPVERSHIGVQDVGVKVSSTSKWFYFEKK